MNYICLIFRFATQTFNGGYKKRLGCKPKSPANIIHYYIFVFFIYFFYHSSCRKDQFYCFKLKIWWPKYVYPPWALPGSISFSAISLNSLIFFSTKPCPISSMVSAFLRNFLKVGVSTYWRAILLSILNTSCWASSRRLSTASVNSSANWGGGSSYNPRRVSNAKVPTPATVYYFQNSIINNNNNNNNNDLEVAKRL